MKKEDEQFYEVTIKRVSVPWGSAHEGPVFGRRRDMWERKSIEKLVKDGDTKYLSDRFLKLLTWLVDEVNDPSGEE